MTAKLITPLFLRTTLATLAYFVAIGMVIPILPLYVTGPLGSTEVAVGLVTGAFAVSAVILRPFAGRLGDKRGRRFLVVSGASAAAVSFALYALADTVPLLIGARLISGVGEALFFVGAAATIQDIAPQARRAEAMSYFSLALYGGLVAGPVLGELIFPVFGFGVVWLVAAAICATGIIAGVGIPDTRPDGHAQSDAAALLHPAGIVPALLLVASVIGLATFNSFIALYARDVFMISSAPIFVVFGSVVIGVRLFGARLPDKFGYKKTVGVSLVCTFLGLLIAGVAPKLATLFLGTVIYSLGQALAFPAIMSMAVNAAPPSQRAAAMSTVSVGFDAAFGAGAIAAGFIVALAGMRVAIVAGGSFALLGLAILHKAPRELDA